MERLTRLKSIRKYCLNCCNDSVDEVRKCTCKSCSLYEYRLGKIPLEKKLIKSKAIRERCLNCSGFIKSDVRNCEINDCYLYRYRMGKEII